MLDHGADGVSFETIVAAGANSAIPHHRPTDAVLAAGDFVKIDFGALVCGYHSDMTRTFVLAPAAQWQLDLYELVAAAQRAGREAVEPGVALRDVDAASRQVIADAGYAEQLHPRPRARRRAGDPRSAGNQRVGRRYTACWLRGDRGARCLLARSRRCPHRGHAGRVRGRWSRMAGDIRHQTCLPSSPRNWPFSVERLGVVPPWHRPPTSRTDSSCNIDGQLWTIVEFQHVKPGKGPAFVRTKLKNVLSGKVVDKTFNAGVKVETATVDRRDTTYLYKDGSDFVFMDSQDYEQHHLPESLVGDDARFLLESLPVQVAFHNGTALYIELPVTVELEVTHTEPGLQGDRSSAGTKPATVETGAEIQVPLFINTGDKLKVDSRDGSYLGRVN